MHRFLLIPSISDADALNCIALNKNWLDLLVPKTIITRYWSMGNDVEIRKTIAFQNNII
jgi:hypothetical protein